MYLATDNDPVSPLSDTATVNITLTGINDAPEVTPPGIPDLTIFTSDPTDVVALFPHFEDVDNNDTDPQLAYAVTMNSNMALVQTPDPIDSVDGLLTVNTPCTAVGTADIEITVTDSGGLTAVDTFKVTVVDDVPPVISGHPKRVIVNAAPGATDAIVHYGPVTALDKVDGARPVSCSPASGTLFALGAHSVTCTSSDIAGNPAMVSFEVLVVETSELGVGAPIATVSIRDESAPGAAGAFFSYQEIYLNDASEVLLEAKAGAQSGVWSDAGSPGTLGLVALKGDPAGALGTFSTFGDLALGDLGDHLFTANSAGHFFNAADVAVEGQTAPGGGIFKILQQPALGDSGSLVTPANLVLNTAGVTFRDDTGIWGTFGGGPLGLVAREGGSVPASAGLGAGALYGQVAARTVINDSDVIAFSANLNVSAGVTLLDNTAVFSGPAAAPLIVAREGSVAPGAEPNVFSGFQSESINNSGEVAFLGSIRAPAGGSPVFAFENQGLWSNLGGTLQLVAAEGAEAPCLPATGVLFDRFVEVFVTDTGEVHFRAFLKGAGVNSSNDESLWRYELGSGLHFVVREGDPAPGTADAPVRDILDYSVSESGLVVYTARLMTGIADVTSSNNQGLFSTDTALGIPVLRVRKGDVYTIAPHDRKITEITLSRSANTKGGTGGYGRVINDAGEIAFRASMNFNSSGVFVLAP